MLHTAISSTSRRATTAIYGGIGGLAAAMFIAGATFVASSPASAKPEFAAQTGLPCGQCHVSPGGGGALKPFGESFKKNGFKLPKK